MTRSIILLVLALVSTGAYAEKDETRHPVVGHFTLTPEGTISEPGFTVAPPTAYESIVMEAMSRWRFEPVVENGQAMSIRVRFTSAVIERSAGDGVAASLGEADFAEIRADRPLESYPPEFPYIALRNSIQGSAIVAYRTRPDGRVADARTIRVGLVNGEQVSNRFRDRAVRDFSSAASRAMARWRFPPTADGEPRIGRYQYDFWLNEAPAPGVDGVINYQWHDIGHPSWYQPPIADAAGEAREESRIRRLPDAAPGG